MKPTRDATTLLEGLAAVVVGCLVGLPLLSSLFGGNHQAAATEAHLLAQMRARMILEHVLEHPSELFDAAVETAGQVDDALWAPGPGGQGWTSLAGPPEAEQSVSVRRTSRDTILVTVRVSWKAPAPRGPARTLKHAVSRLVARPDAGLTTCPSTLENVPDASVIADGDAPPERRPHTCGADGGKTMASYR